MFIYYDLNIPRHMDDEISLI